MNTEIQTLPKSQDIAQYGFSQSDYAILKSKICKDAPDDEIQFFCKVAQARNLNPFTGQICLVSRNAKNEKGEWTKTYTIQTQIAGLRAIADRTQKYAPSNIPAKFDYDDKGNLISATVFIKKFVAGEWHQISETAYLEEFIQTKKDSKPTQFWASKPRLMLAKCAEALALRKAFPDELSNLYTSDELNEPDPIDALGESLPKEIEPWNEDPEEVKTISKAQAQRLYTIAKSEKGQDGLGLPLPRWTDEQAKDYITSLGYESSKEIPQGEIYDGICKYLEEHPGHFQDIEGQAKVEVK